MGKGGCENQFGCTGYIAGAVILVAGGWTQTSCNDVSDCLGELIAKNKMT